MKTIPASMPLEKRQALQPPRCPSATALAPGLNHARVLGYYAIAGDWQILELLQLYEEAVAEMPPPLVAGHSHPYRTAAFLSQAPAPIGTYQRGIHDLNASLSTRLSLPGRRGRVKMTGCPLSADAAQDTPTIVRMEISTPVNRRCLPSSGTSTLVCP